jgi:hypothetical protein
MHKRHIRAALAAFLILILGGCSSSQIVTNLEIALDAIQAGLPILGGVSGVPAEVVSTAEDYLSAANAALGQASTILAGGGTDAEKTAQILAAFASIAQPAIPAQYGAIAQLVSLVAGDIFKFLAGLPSSTASTAVAHDAATRTTKWSDKDIAGLAHAQSVATSNKLALAKLRGK